MCYSRLAALMKDFTTAFTAADHVIITEVVRDSLNFPIYFWNQPVLLLTFKQLFQIYAARELNEWNSDGRELASLIKGPSSEYIRKMVKYYFLKAII